MRSNFDPFDKLENILGKFNDWVSYLNDELKPHRPGLSDRERYIAFEAVANTKFPQVVFESFRAMDWNTKQAEPQQKDDCVYGNIHNLDVLFFKLKSYNTDLDEVIVRLALKSHGRIWDPKDFKLLKRASALIYQLFQHNVEVMLPDYFSTAKQYLSVENENNIIKYTKTPFIRTIVEGIINNHTLDNSHSNNSLKATIQVIKAKPKFEPSFKANIKNHKKYSNTNGKVLIQLEIEGLLKDMMNSLIKHKFIDPKTKASDFLKIFSGEIVPARVKWIGLYKQLKYFIVTLYESGIVDKVKGNYYWRVAEQCFSIGEDQEKFQTVIRQAIDPLLESDLNTLNICINHLNAIKSR